MSQIALLLVEDDPGDAVLIRELMRQNDLDNEFSFTHATTVATGIKVLDSEAFDAVLLDLTLPDTVGLATIRRLREGNATVPIVVVTGEENLSFELDVIRAGAHEFLAKSALTADNLVRTVRFAIERHRCQDALMRAKLRGREQRDREIRALEQMATPPNTALTAASFHASPIRESLPDHFSDFTDDYRALLEEGADRGAHRPQEGRREAVRVLARQLGFLGAGPRDLIDVHLAALRQALNHAETARAELIEEEGRHLLIEAMGNLVLHYRSRSAASPARTSTTRETEDARAKP